MVLKAVGWDNVDWIHLAQDRDLWPQYWTYGSHKMLAIHWQAEQVLRKDSATFSWLVS
jgi:hypothetical protein